MKYKDAFNKWNKENDLANYCCDARDFNFYVSVLERTWEACEEFMLSINCTNCKYFEGQNPECESCRFGPYENEELLWEKQ